MTTYYNRNRQLYKTNALFFLYHSLKNDYEQDKHLSSILTIKTSDYGCEFDNQRFFWSSTNPKENIKMQLEFCYYCGNYDWEYFINPDKHNPRIFCSCW